MGGSLGRRGAKGSCQVFQLLVGGGDIPAVILQQLQQADLIPGAAIGGLIAAVE